MPPYQSQSNQPTQPEQPQQSVPVQQAPSAMPIPSAPPAPTPVFGQGPVFDVASVEHKFPIWVIPVLAFGILGSGALVTCVIVFMR